jgi:hypothetical protein
MKGLAKMLPGKGASKEAPKPEPEPEDAETAALRQAFDAVKDEDVDGFIAAIKLAIRSCEYDEEDEDGDDVAIVASASPDEDD